jgi:hypothetical protein
MANSQQANPNAALVRLFVCSIFSPSSRERASKKGGARGGRGAALPEFGTPHGFLMKVCLMERGEAATWPKKKIQYGASAKQPLREHYCTASMEFSPPMSNFFFNDFIR